MTELILKGSKECKQQEKRKLNDDDVLLFFNLVSSNSSNYLSLGRTTPGPVLVPSLAPPNTMGFLDPTKTN